MGYAKIVFGVVDATVSRYTASPLAVSETYRYYIAIHLQLVPKGSSQGLRELIQCDLRGSSVTLRMAGNCLSRAHTPAARGAGLSLIGGTAAIGGGAMTLWVGMSKE